MKFYSVSLPNVTPIKLVIGKANYGIGFLTSFVGGFCSLFGIPNGLFTQKLQKAEALAMEELTEAAEDVGADGVMDIRCQIDGLSFLVSGTAYKLSQEEKAKREAEMKARREAEEKAKREAEEKARREAEEKPRQEAEEKIVALPCPECGEDLSFMGWSEDELKEKQTCPFCGKDNLLNK